MKTAAIIVGAVALVATGIGAAAGATLLGATTLAAGASAATVATFATIATVATVASVAAGVLSLAAGLTAKRPTAADATGSPNSFSADPDAGIPLVLGRTGNAGNIIFRKEYDTADAGVNDRQAFVVALSLGPVAAIEGMTVDRSPVSFSAGAALGAFAGFMWSITQLGAVPQASALTFGAGAGTPSGWTSAHKLSGLAAATWVLRFDTKAKFYQNGVPAPMWTVKGVLAYDPRKDSTYPGGSGSHRMADPADTAAYDAAVATWEWTENPYLLGLRWAHGFWQRDPTVAGSKWVRVMGMGAPHAGIDVSAFVEGANIAQANGWACGGIIYSGDDKWDSLKKILQTGMGEPLALGAKISCLVNAPKVSLATITVDDVVGDASVTATQPRRDRINTVTPRYRLEVNNWELLPATPITVPDYVTVDRGKRSKVLDYPFIQQTSQIGTAVRYDIENAREFGPISLPLKLVWMGYKPGDCVTCVLPELGLNAQPVLLLNRSLDPSGGTVTMTARSETAGKHAFALGQTTTAPPTPGVTGPALVPVPGVMAWAITGTSIVSGDVTVPALVIDGAVDVGTADAVIFDYRPFVSGQPADDGWIGAGVEPPAVKMKIIGGVGGNAAYEVGVSYRARGVIGNRRVLGPGTTASYEGTAGEDGPAGLNNATAMIFKRSATNPATPSVPATYTFGTGISGLDNGWTQDVPAGSTPLWISIATASSVSASDTIAPGEWASPVVQARDGVDGDPGNAGVNAKSLFIYQRAAAVPALPSVSSTYTFSSQVLTGLNNGWLTSVPAGSDPIYVSTASALSTTDSDTIAAGEWAEAAVLAQNGSDGAAGVSPSVVDVAASSLSFAANYDGSIKTGQQPRNVQASFMVGTTDRTSVASWTIADSSNCSASVNSAGLTSIGSVTGDGYVVVQGSYGGITPPTKRISFTRNKDAAPPAGATSLSSPISGTQLASASSYPTGVSTGVLTVTADGSGRLQCVLEMSYYADASSGGASTFHFFVIAAVARYRVAGSSSAWNDFSAGEVVGTSSSSPGYDVEPESEGTISLNQTQTGLSAGVQYEVGVARRRSTNLRSSQATYTGTITVKQP